MNTACFDVYEARRSGYGCTQSDAYAQFRKQTDYPPGQCPFMLIPVIFSGGAGTRLWPAPREACPFIKIAAGESLPPGILGLVMIEVQSGEYLAEDNILRFDDRYGRA